MRRKIEHFTDADAWQYGNRLAIKIYNITKGFPKEELFGLTNQIRRASFSITANIAEGNGRRTPADRRRFFLIASGSALECAAILDILTATGTISSSNASQGKENLRRIVSMLVKMTTPKDSGVKSVDYAYEYELSV